VAELTDRDVNWMIFEYLKRNLFVTASISRGGSKDGVLEVYLHDPEGKPALIAGAKL